MLHRMRVAVLCGILQVGCAAQLAPKGDLLSDVEIQQETYQRGDYVSVVYFDAQKRLKTIEGYIKSIDSNGITLNVFNGVRIARKDIEQIVHRISKQRRGAQYLSVSGGVSNSKTNFNAIGFAIRSQQKRLSHDVAFEIFFKENEGGWFTMGPTLNVHPFQWRVFSPYILAGGGLAGSSFGFPMAFHSKVGVGLQVLPSEIFVIRSEIRRDGFSSWSLKSFRIFIDLAF